MMSKKKIDKFKTYITECGGEILSTTNPYEVVRFKTKNGISVLYEGRRGYSFVGDARKLYDKFLNGDSAYKILSRKDELKIELAKQVIERDGEDCFYCGKKTIAKSQNPHQDDIMTLEHLLSIACGGNNNIANMVIACHRCNQEVGDIPIIEKIKYRELRSKK